MSLHINAFEFLKPTDRQMAEMQSARAAMAQCANELDRLVPEGPDKTFIMRSLRDVAMWANVAITRLPDGSPRT